MSYIRKYALISQLFVYNFSDDEHVTKVCNNIKNERAVAKSKMFPFRYYTAFDVLSELEEFADKKYEPPKKVKNRNPKVLENMINDKMAKQYNMNRSGIKRFEQALNDAIGK